MKAEDLVIGGKYVPHQKTVGCDINESVWNNIKLKQPYMYYKGKDKLGNHLFCFHKKDIRIDYFNPEDVTSYNEQ